MNTIARYKARWAVRGYLEIPDVYFDPDATHGQVAPNSSLLVMIIIMVMILTI